MTSNNPHYLLFSEASQDHCLPPTWRFVLQNVESQRRFAATDSENCECSERLELLAVVRGLEALDGPARVTLVTKSRYVSRGIKKGLAQWRENNWCWERFGRTVPVRDHDLWQRVDRALQFHEVHCQAWQFETVEVVADSIPAEVPVISSRTRRRFDAPHQVRGTHPVRPLRRRAKLQAASLSDAFRTVTGALGEAMGASS